MEVITLNSANYIGLSSNYSPDPSLILNQGIYYTEQGMDFPLAKILASANDSSTNNYSNLFLTQSQPLSSTAYIHRLEHIPDDGFTTYLAIKALEGITTNSFFMSVQEPDINTSVAAVSVSGTIGHLDNSYLFTIKFYDDRLCKVEHVNGYTPRYLTINSDNTLFFAFDTDTDYLEDRSPQLFYYSYDKEGNNFTLFKNNFDIAYVIAVDKSQLVAISPVSGAEYPFPPNAIFECIPRPQEPNSALLYDPWVSYKKDFLTNSQNISFERSVENINSNLLVNSQYLTLTGSALDVNVLSLKNTNTPENYQSRNNPFQSDKSLFLTENEVEFRDYKRLFTGSNQELGDDNITLGYEAYTTDIVLKADSITYFHVPQTLYPFTQINVNDAGLIKAGAIAGDHPIKADKIFKKLDNAKYTSPFGGDNIDETDGSFLCSWLSGNTDVNTMPVWVDRYYNPSKTTFINALTSRSLKAVTYSTVLEGFVQEAGVISNTDEVFDVPSDLVFEPGCYYAYHHYGKSDVDKFIDIFTPFIVERDIPNYFYSTVSSPATPLPDNEYAFDAGDKYGITESLSGIQISNQFTLCFDMYNSDWSKPFANQIIGNLLNDGFGMYNQNIITPTIFVNTTSGVNAELDILNTDFTNIKKVVYNTTASPLTYIRSRFGDNYSVVFNDCYLRQYTCDDRQLRQSFSPYLSNYVAHTNTDSTAFILCSSTSAFVLLSASLISNALSTVRIPSVSAQFHFASGADINSSLASTIHYYNSGFYFTPGRIARRASNVIYYLTDSDTSIVKWDKIDTSTTQTTAFKTSNQSTFTDFNIDYDGNIWILNNNNSYYKYTQNNVFLLSGTLTSNTPTTITLNITGNGKTLVHPFTATGASPGDINVRIGRNTLRPVLDYSLSGNNIVLITPVVSGVLGTATYSTSADTFKNYKVSFVSEFANNSYYTNTLFARTGYRTQPNRSTSFPLLTSQAYQLVTVDMHGVQQASSIYFANTGRLTLTNSSYLREYVYDRYLPTNFNVKAITTNIYDNTDLSVNEIIYDISKLDPGYHHFAVRFDSYHGYMSLFIDGQVAGSVQFTPRKYKFSNLIYRPFLIGSSTFNNSIPLFNYLKKNAYLAENIKIKNFYLYSTPLNDYDIIMHARKGRDIQDIHFDVSCGRRNYLEEIERYFKASLPGSKSTQYNIILRNTGITDPSLRSAIEARINTVLSRSAPVYSKLNTIKWVN